MKNRKILFKFVFGVWAISASLFLQSQNSFAQELDWGEVEVVSRDPVDHVTKDSCKKLQQYIKVSNEQDLSKVCMVSTESEINFGIRYFDKKHRAVISFGSEKKMYRLNITCSYGYNSCLYLPEYDTLVMRRSTNNYLTQNLVVYKDFSQRVSKTYDMSTLEVEYRFDYDDPDYMYEKHSGARQTIGAIAASENGRWIAMELRGGGVARMDLETMRIKRVSTENKLSYGTGRMPVVEMAITNDGRYLTYGGFNAGTPKIVEVKEECGDFPAENDVGSNPNTQCETFFLNSSGLSFSHSYRPMFNANGEVLSFIGQPGTSSKDREFIQVKMSGSSLFGLEYLALGDSFTSGEGEISDDWYEPGTNIEHEKCHLSKRSYPFLLAEKLELPQNSYKSVACSGATTKDMLPSGDEYLGQNDRLGLGQLNLYHHEVVAYKQQAIENFIPGRVHQSDFVSTYQPRLITVGVGGNDAGFIDKLKDCLSPGTCYWAESDQAIADTAAEIDGVSDKIAKVLNNINQSSPTSTVYLVGYPKIIIEDSSCGILTELLLSEKEKKFMNQSISRMNKMLKETAESSGAIFVDVEDVFGEHALCGDSENPAMNAVRFGDDARLISYTPKIIAQESFHPTPNGHKLIVDRLEQSVGNPLPAQSCDDDCSEETNEFWDVGVEPKPQQNYTFAKVDKESNEISVDITGMGFAPGFSVELKVGDDQDVFYTETRQHGEVNDTFALPDDLEEDYHTVWLKGESLSGEVISLYQTIDNIDEPEEVFESPLKNPEEAESGYKSEVPSEAPNTTPVNVTPLTSIGSTRLEGGQSVDVSLAKDKQDRNDLRKEVAVLSETSEPEGPEESKGKFGLIVMTPLVLAGLSATCVGLVLYKKHKKV